jgi:toxin ParE1/3/4
MRKQKIFFWPKARRDVIEIRRYIAQDNPEVAEAFHDVFQKTCAALLDLPEMGSRRTFGNPELSGLRMLLVPKFEKYLIFYLNNDDGLEIVRVVHGARDLPSLFVEWQAKRGEEKNAV